MIGRGSSIHIMGAMQTNLEPKKILVVLHGSIGDVTRALPLANLIHRGFPKATLAWAVEPPCLPLVEHHPAVDEVILFDRPRWWNQLGPFLRKNSRRSFRFSVGSATPFEKRHYQSLERGSTSFGLSSA